MKSFLTCFSISLMLWIIYLFTFWPSPVIFLLSSVAFIQVILGIKISKFLPQYYYWFVQLYFICLAPIASYANPETDLEFHVLNNHTLPLGFILPLIFNFSFLLESKINIKINLDMSIIKFFNSSSITLLSYFSSNQSLLVIISTLFGFISIVLGGGVRNILLPRQGKEDAYSIFFYLVLAFSIVSFYIIVAIINNKIRQKKALRLNSIILIASLIPLILNMLLINPFNTARFILIQTWLPLLLIAFPSLSKKQYSLTLSFFFLLLLMPILSATTRFGESDVGSFLYSISQSREAALSLITKYIDVVPINSYIINNFDFNDLKYGQNFLLLFIFFIPRAIYSAKPELSSLEYGGYLLSSGLTGTDNLSFPVYNELYIDFWYLGVIAGGVFFSYLLRLSCLLASTIIPIIGLKDSNMSVGILLLTSSIPILCRGPVPAILPYTFSIFIAVFFFAYISEKFGSSTQP